jgi:hypothetical protein
MLKIPPPTCIVLGDKSISWISIESQEQREREREIGEREEGEMETLSFAN